MIQITDVILIALFIEAIVNALKPIWSADGEKLSISEYVSMGMGILIGRGLQDQYAIVCGGGLLSGMGGISSSTF